jgi:EAL and modified HD-GYP domain-containing signal transduction protein
MGEILNTLAVDDKIREALTGGSGTLGSLLTLMRNWEEDALGYFVGTLSTVPPLTMDDFNHAASEAMSWAASLGQ